MMEKNKIRDFMVHDPMVALSWQPISFVREQMLTNGYSFIPIQLLRKSRSYWGLISEYAIAKYLRHDQDEKERKRRLTATVDQAIKSEGLEIAEAEVCSPTDSIYDVLRRLNNMPILVIDASHPDKLIGIVTAFDFM
jgi:CBS domain-containing protein